MMKHLLFATALLAAAFTACPASAQQARPSAGGYGMVDDDYRDGQRSDSYRDDEHDRGYRHEHHDNVIRCESIDNRRAYCGTHNAHQVVLVNRLSDASCIKNRSWGYNGRGIWVDRGCRGDFRVRG